MARLAVSYGKIIVCLILFWKKISESSIRNSSHTEVLCENIILKKDIPVKVFYCEL